MKKRKQVEKKKPDFRHAWQEFHCRFLLFFTDDLIQVEVYDYCRTIGRTGWVSGTLKPKCWRVWIRGAVLHAERANIDIKNLLATGEVTSGEVSAVIRRARGTDYSCSQHHTVASVDVHVIRARLGGQTWYIKWYFLEPDSVFISVHH